MSCPCGSEKKFLECCGKYIRGEEAPDALALMRSRYSAYATGHVDYILRTTHPAHKDAKTPKPAWRKQIEAFCENTRFVKLEILSHEPGEPFSFVSFRAHLIQEGRPVILAEKSRFEKLGSSWLYLDGVLEELR